MVIHVQDQILTHHSQTNESNIRSVEIKYGDCEKELS